MKTFYVRSPSDPNGRRPALAIIHGPQDRAKMDALPEGTYDVRDCLGGLRFRIAVDGGAARVIERTP